MGFGGACISVLVPREGPVVDALQWERIRPNGNWPSSVEGRLNCLLKNSATQNAADKLQIKQLAAACFRRDSEPGMRGRGRRANTSYAGAHSGSYVPRPEKDSRRCGIRATEAGGRAWRPAAHAEI